jgi:hypothetical protein
MLLRNRFVALASACCCLTSLALAACTPAASPRPATSPRPAKSGTLASRGFAGYDWIVVAISHAGMVTPIPAGYGADLRFSRAGRFGANDPINYHGGNYRITPNGFATSGMGGTLVGYAGHNPVILLTQSAMMAFGNGAHATVQLTGNRLVVTVASYTLTCQRHGPAGSNV